MMDLGGARKLVSERRYVEAARLLDQLLAIEKENDGTWYLRGVVSLKMKNYNSAEEAFERALWIKQKPEYWTMKGLSYMESVQFGEAVYCFEHSLKFDKKDVNVYVYMALCYMFLNDSRSRVYIQRAYLHNKKKTKELLKNFYASFFKNNPAINKKTNEMIGKKLDGIIE